MKTSRSYSSLLIAAAFATVLLATAMSAPRARAADPATIKFSDPAKPGTVKVTVKMGDITIAGTDRDDVSVETDFHPEGAPVRKDGLRVISESATYSLSEKDNVVMLDTGDSWSGFGSDTHFVLEVPRSTNVVIANGFGGEIAITNLDGNIEIKSINGEIDLDDIGGGVLVETMNGEIRANLSRLNPDKPISISSMNGEIDLHVPNDAQAKVRLRTQNGAILTDFDEKALVTKTESIRSKSTSNFNVRVSSDTQPEIREAMREAIRAGVEAAREAAQAMREAAQAAREAAEEVRVHGSDSVAVVAPVPPVPPVPTMTGGKLVSGTLNGGNGPEIYAATMNGDITLRKVD